MLNTRLHERIDYANSAKDKRPTQKTTSYSSVPDTMRYTNNTIVYLGSLITPTPHSLDTQINDAWIYVWERPSDLTYIL